MALTDALTDVFGVIDDGNKRTRRASDDTTTAGSSADNKEASVVRNFPKLGHDFMYDETTGEFLTREAMHAIAHLDTSDNLNRSSATVYTYEIDSVDVINISDSDARIVMNLRNGK